MRRYWLRYLLLAALCGTLGIAPRNGTPHVIERARWIAEGSDQMGPFEWFDFVMHAAPWTLLVVALVVDGSRLLRRRLQAAKT